MIAKVYDLMGRPAGEKDSKDFKVKCFFILYLAAG
jgi:hypothetical protein